MQQVFCIEFPLTPEGFERLVFEHVKTLGNKLQSFECDHNVIVDAFDGSYQIDIKAIFEFLDVSFVVLIECKRHSNPIKREIVQILNSKLHSTGAHKGIIFSTSPFQEGAIEYARQHGIALVEVINGLFETITPMLSLL